MQLLCPTGRGEQLPGYCKRTRTEQHQDRRRGAAQDPQQPAPKTVGTQVPLTRGRDGDLRNCYWFYLRSGTYSCCRQARQHYHIATCPADRVGIASSRSAPIVEYLRHDQPLTVHPAKRDGMYK